MLKGKLKLKLWKNVEINEYEIEYVLKLVGYRVFKGIILVLNI